MASQTNGGASSTAADTQTEAATENNQIDEEEKEESEYDSDYDEEGRYIWGQEGEDWEFYYQEDKDAYEKGESTVPETLNPGALPPKVTVQSSTATGQVVDTVIGVSMARDGAVYRTTKKKLKAVKAAKQAQR